MSKPHDRTPLVGGDQTAAVQPSNSTDFQKMTDNQVNQEDPEQPIQNGQNGQESGNTNTTSSNDNAPVPEQTAWIFSIVMICISCGVAVGTNIWIECILAFGVNYLVFAVYAWPFHTEKIYDFTGMLTFLTLDLFAFFNYPKALKETRSIVTFCMPLLWTLRLGIFLFKRILGEGGADKRFDPIRNNFPRFFMSWSLQAVWAYFCMLPVLVVQKRADSEIGLKPTDYIGWFLWVFGFAFEVIADRQKTVFKENPANRGKFTNVGLWRLSRHPNYFGEITLWWGLAIVACSVAEDWLWLMFLSPIWTMVLLIGLSGIPLSEKTADKKYGNVDGYTEYKATTPVLVPFCYCWK